ncbi:uncharacterized protein LOC101740169 isoform X1 [Bombyx mori]|uniref:Tetraspanin n=1 Tax=Bombyx mori TaxID=7091 RepID=A0A8R2QUP9_BOMMO|nr:uncharacterized protein LOC101740169 [Bombyx mori]XP_037869511.1 uncharacterized protein LOC101740169 [Bombyx mori]
MQASNRGCTEIVTMCIYANSTGIGFIYGETSRKYGNMGELKDIKVGGSEVSLELPKDGSPVESSRKRKLRIKKPSVHLCRKITFVTISTFTMLTALTLIVITVVTSLATKIYDVEQSSRLVGMVVLAVTAAITISMLIYSNVGVFKKRSKPLHTMRIVLIILAMIQALIAGLAVKMSTRDAEGLSKSLADSFLLAQEDNSRHVKLWAATQHDLACCGVYSPEDYKNPKIPKYFPPDVPISCCPTYDPQRSPLLQEKERELCKAQRVYHPAGCTDLVIKAFRDTAYLVLAVTINLIMLEILCAICGSVIVVKNRKIEKCEEEAAQTK